MQLKKKSFWALDKVKFSANRVAKRRQAITRGKRYKIN